MESLSCWPACCCGLFLSSLSSESFPPVLLRSLMCSSLISRLSPRLWCGIQSSTSPPVIGFGDTHHLVFRLSIGTLWMCFCFDGHQPLHQGERLKISPNNICSSLEDRFCLLPLAFISLFLPPHFVDCLFPSVSGCPMSLANCLLLFILKFRWLLHSFPFLALTIYSAMVGVG